MSGRVRATTDVQLASDSFLAFKQEAYVVIEKQVIASWNQSWEEPEDITYSRSHSFKGQADDIHEWTALVVGPWMTRQQWAPCLQRTATSENRPVVFMQECSSLLTDLQIFQVKPEL